MYIKATSLDSGKTIRIMVAQISTYESPKDRTITVTMANRLTHEIIGDVNVFERIVLDVAKTGAPEVLL